MERSSVAAVIICLTLSGAVPSRQVSSRGVNDSLGAASHVAAQSLQLTSTIVAQKYCKADSDIDGVDLRLLLTFINHGPERILLYKSSGAVLRHMVSRNVEEAAKQEYVTSVSSTWYSAGQEEKLDERLLATLFVPLAPGESYQLESDLRVFASRRGQTKKTGCLDAGQYMLEIQVATWPASLTIEQGHLANRQRDAVVWQRSVTSEPFPLTIEEHRQIEDCSPFQELLEASQADPNVRNADGLTALLLAISPPDTERFLSLLAAGADVNMGTNSGITPLMMAAGYSDSLFVTELIRRGANINPVSEDGTTALLEAVRAGLAENVKLLIEAGATANLRSKDGRSALMLSRQLRDEKSRAEIVRLLRSAGAREW